MTEPIQLLESRLEEINSQLRVCIDNRHPLKEIKTLRLKYQYAIKIITDFLIDDDDENRKSSRNMYGLLSDKAIKDIQNNYISGVHKNKPYGSSFFADKYGVAKSTIRKVAKKK